VVVLVIGFEFGQSKNYSVTVKRPRCALLVIDPTPSTQGPLVGQTKQERNYEKPVVNLVMPAPASLPPCCRCV
jgi:hypothetical protein